jgi:hypothetical protein
VRPDVDRQAERGRVDAVGGGVVHLDDRDPSHVAGERLGGHVDVSLDGGRIAGDRRGIERFVHGARAAGHDRSIQLRAQGHDLLEVLLELVRVLGGKPGQQRRWALVTIGAAGWPGLRAGWLGRW